MIRHLLVLYVIDMTKFQTLGQVKSECLTCTFRASGCSARLSRAHVPAFAGSSVRDRLNIRTHLLYMLQALRLLNPALIFVPLYRIFFAQTLKKFYLLSWTLVLYFLFNSSKRHLAHSVVYLKHSLRFRY